MLLGAIVIVGWFTHTPTLIQVNENFVPMQFNTALCFFLLGIASLSLKKNSVISIVGSILVLIISCLTLVEYVFGVNLGIDELFMQHYITTYTSSPGRMAPNTAICFTLGGIVLLCLNRKRIGPRAQLTLVIASMTMLLLSITAIWGYLADVPTTYSWRNLTAMAVHTSLGFMLISVSFLIGISSRVEIFKKIKISFITAISAACMILMIWSSMKVQFQNAFVEKLTGDSKSIQYELMAEFSYLETAVDRLFARESRKGYSSQENLEKDINDYLKDIPSLDAILMNNKLYIKGSEKKRFQSIIKQCFAASGNDFLKQKDTVYYCMKNNKEAALINLNTLMKNNLKKYSFQKINIGIYYKDNEILILGNKIRAEKLAVGKRFVIPFSKNLIEVLIQPTETYINSEVYYLTDVFLSVAIILVILLTLAIRNWETSKENLMRLEKASESKKEVEAHFEAIVAASPTVFLIVDRQGVIWYATKNCHSLLLYSNTELVGNKVELLIPKMHRKKHVDYRTDYFKNPINKAMGERIDLYALRKDNIEVPVEISLAPIQNEGETQVLCTIMDRALHKQLEHEQKEKRFMRTIYECAEITNQYGDFRIALEGCLDKICEYVKWPVGHIYFIEGNDTKKRLVSSGIWYCKKDLNIDDFKKVTQETDFKIGVGLPGRVWKSKQPEWIEDVSKDDNFPRAGKCQDFPLKAGAALPIIINEQILAVLEFFDTKEQPIDSELLKLFSLLSIQTSRLLERKKAQEDLEASEKRIRLLLESAGEGIYGLNLKGETTFVNPAALEMLGYTIDELLGQSMHELVHYAFPDGSTYPKEKCPMYAAYKDGAVHRVTDEVLWRKDKTPIWVEYISSPIYHKNTLTGAVVIFNDISERKETQKKLLKYAKALEESNKELDDFAYIVSHDLKEPLRGIENFSKILLEDHEDELDEEGVEELHTLIKLSNRMRDLISSILTYSRVGRQELAFKQVDINTIINEKKDLLDHFLQEQNATVTIENPLPTILCDINKIGEVFQNLITNAVKYNDSEEKKIRISCKALDNAYQFSVSDNGIGIREADQDKIFKMFYRLHARGEYGGGTGAGMTIVEKIVKRHNGKIWIESSEGKGTTIHFTIAKDLSLK